MAIPQEEKYSEGQRMEFTDKSGAPRSRRDVEAALQAVKERLIKGPHDGFTIHLPVIKDVLEVELRMRTSRGE